MPIGELLSLQSELFMMILAGWLMKRTGVITEAGKKCLTDLCVNLVIPCTILKSFLMELDPDVMQACGIVLFVSAASQIGFGVANKFLFNRYPSERKKVLQYCMICSNGGFMGNTVCEGVYGNLGLLYASFYMIPMRIMVWSTGLSYFTSTGGKGWKHTVKTILTHPCLVSVYVGMFIMLMGIKLPDFLVGTIQGIGCCNSAMTMMIIGTILADVNLLTIVNRHTLWCSTLRLILLPGSIFILCRLLGMSNVATGVSVLLTGMPVGSTAAIFAAQYDSDASFATKCVVCSTMASMITLPLWCVVCGA